MVSGLSICYGLWGGSAVVSRRMLADVVRVDVVRRVLPAIAPVPRAPVELWQ